MGSNHSTQFRVRRSVAPTTESFSPAEPRSDSRGEETLEASKPHQKCLFCASCCKRRSSQPLIAFSEVLELEKAEERRARLVVAIASEEVPVDRQTPVSELEILRAKVAHLEAAREPRSERGSVEALEKSTARADDVMNNCCSTSATWNQWGCSPI